MGESNTPQDPEPFDPIVEMAYQADKERLRLGPDEEPYRHDVQPGDDRLRNKLVELIWIHS